MLFRATIPLLAAFALLAFAACDSDSDPDTNGQPSPTTTPPGIAVGEPTPPSGPTTTRDEPTPAPTPDTDDRPSVEWVSLNHGGAGAVILVIETNVPTSVEVIGVAAPGATNLPGAASGTSDELATSHVLALATGGLDLYWEITAVDAEGRKARATIESGAIVQQQYWAAAGPGVPAVTLDAGLTATATWFNLAGEEPRQGEVILLARTAGCTTADSCLGSFAAAFEGDEPAFSPDGSVEHHEIAFEFPDDQHDFQVLLVGNPAESDRAFYQVDVLAADLQ